MTPAEIRVLLVDDDTPVLRATSAAMRRRGATVEMAVSGREAIKRVRSASWDVIVSDLSMPEMSGLDLLREVRAYDLDVPVILTTGHPDLETAMRAVEYGAFRYLPKPVAAEVLWEVIQRATRLRQLARLKDAALQLPGAGGPRLAERAALEVRFNAALTSLWLAFQPIVDWRAKQVYGYEALLRSDEPMMKQPAELFDAAMRLDRLHELGRAVRSRAAAACVTLTNPSLWLFVNIHAADLNDDQLYAPDAPLSKLAPRVVLEITERSSLEGVRNVTQQARALKRLGFQVAVDDLGSGVAGLSGFTIFDPEVVKLDISLVRGVDTDSRRQAIIRSMLSLCDQLGILAIAEGVETIDERRVLCELGCNYLQGYLFSRPERAFPSPRW